MAVIDEVEIRLMRNPKTWLVTGAAGFIGVNLCMKLFRLNQKVIALDSYASCGDESKSVYDMMSFKRKYLLDVRKEEVYQAIQDSDVILHQAGIGNVPRSFEQPVEYAENNILGSINIFDLAKKYGNKRVVWASSSAAKHPISPYGLGKKTIEDFSTFYQNVIGLRYHNVYGSYQANRAAIPIFIDRAIKGNDIEVYGNCYRDFTHVHDVVDANILAAVAEMSIDWPETKVFDIGTGNSISVVNVASKIKSLSGSQSQIKQLPKREGDILISKAEIDSASVYFGFRAKYDIHVGLRNFVDFSKSRTER